MSHSGRQIPDNCWQVWWGLFSSKQRSSPDLGFQPKNTWKIFAVHLSCSRATISVRHSHQPSKTMPYRLHIRSARKYTPAPSRNRLLYAVLVLLVIGTGLLWRSRFLPLSPFACKYGGDALWAAVVFVGFGFLFRHISTLRLSLLAFGFAWVVEFSQLYHAPWVDAIRSTLPGRLVLGSTFNWPDLAAYAVGITLSAMLEFLVCKSVTGKSIAPD